MWLLIVMVTVVREMLGYLVLLDLMVFLVNKDKMVKLVLMDLKVLLD